MIIQNSECSLNGIVNDSSVCVAGGVRRENNSLTQIFFFVVLINTISSIPSISPTQSSSSFLYKHCFHSALFCTQPFPYSSLPIDRSFFFIFMQFPIVYRTHYLCHMSLKLLSSIPTEVASSFV